MTQQAINDFVLAAGRNEIVKAKEFLRIGISPNGVDERGLTALDLASEYAQADMIKLLLRAGADCNFRKTDHTLLYYGYTPLIGACLSGRPEIINILLRAKAEVNVQRHNSTPLGIALFNKCNGSALQILAYGADPNVPGYNGAASIAIAVAHSDFPMVDALLRAGANADSRLVEGYSVLEQAIGLVNAPIVEALLQHGANPAVRDNDGFYALMLAIARGDANIVQLLLRYHAPLDLKDRQGQTVLDYAKLTGRSDLIQIIEDALKSTNNQTQTAKPNSVHQDTQPSAAQQLDQTYEQLSQELNALIGLENIKSDVQQLMTFLQVQKQRREHGLKVPEESLHMVFTGNPGTGKTTIARLVAKLYKSMGILSTGQLIETDRSGLVAGYLGQTAIKVQEIVQTALGGVLFVDEAYSLTEGDTAGDLFGHEAIDTLLKLMEDQRGNLVVIAAGYTTPMQRFVLSNPGLQSRFNKFLFFDDYNPDQLTDIFQHFAATNDYTVDQLAVDKCRGLFTTLYANRDQTFGNARLARNLFEKTINRQAVRVMRIKDANKEALCNLKADDIPAK